MPPGQRRTRPRAQTQRGGVRPQQKWGGGVGAGLFWLQASAPATVGGCQPDGRVGPLRSSLQPGQLWSRRVPRSRLRHSFRPCGPDAARAGCPGVLSGTALTHSCCENPSAPTQRLAFWLEWQPQAEVLKSQTPAPLVALGRFVPSGGESL